MILPSSPIAGFDPYDDPKADDLLAIVEAATGKTLKIKAQYFGQATPSTNYKWSSTFDYPVDAIVDHMGKWYLSLQTPNLGQNPVSSPLFWEEQVKAGTGLIYWIAAVYTADPAVVIGESGGIEGIYKLNSATPRPFLSSDFDAELLAGHWVLLSSLSGGSSISFVDREVPAGAINGVNTVFVLSDTPQAGSEHVYLNGILQTVADDYTIAGDTITSLIAPATGDKLRVSFRITASASFIDKETPAGAINDVNVIFTLASAPVAGSEHVYLNGILQDSADDYGIVTNTITFAVPPETGDKLKVSYRI